MKSFTTSTLISAAACALLASARPLSQTSRALGASDVANDMQDAIDGVADCKDVAVIFARGTFDSGNIGVWVGPQFQQALSSKINSLAFQGVDSDAYAADLQGYLGESGSDGGSQALAQTVTDYTAKCPDSTVVISGWSQGALVAHKGLGLLSSDVQKKVAGLTVFGDPQQLFSSEAVPSGIQFNSQCFTGTVLDPLCANVPGDFKLPTSIDDIVGPFTDLPSLAVGADEVKAAATLVVKFPGQLLKAGSAFLKTLTSNPQRLLLTPEHFMYGNKGLTSDAATFVAGLPAVAGK
ncbi:carbohydrate esterase family 5 protein [Flagelloscypha sp. PMI_526]|nr:carbohydrate esterase family 5 protein [Flagelloscypha sp. PMI_526]